MLIPFEAKLALKQEVGAANVQTDELTLLLNAYDCSLSRGKPDLVVTVERTEQVAAVVQILSRFHIPFTARSAATNHAGSCSAPAGGAVLNLAPLNHILEINSKNQYAWVEPGVINEQLQQELAPLGFFYAPDPASGRACTIGGNMAQNASGARCLKYGGTLDHILAAEVVLPNGETLQLDRKAAGPDWLGVLTGSEGTLGLVTKIKVKILPMSPAIKTYLITFPSLESCVQAVSDLVARGVIARCMEAMDQLTIHTIEAFAHAGYPQDAQAILLLELDNTPQLLEQEEKILKAVCRANLAQQFIPANTPEEKTRLWKGRRAAYAAMARLAPNVLVCDGTVPRSQLPRTLIKVRQILQKYQVKAGLLFHAGDGNFHPQIIFDERDTVAISRVRQAVQWVLQACIEQGGTISGEHGIGLEKRDRMIYLYSRATLDLFARIKRAFDPQELANPLKIIPPDYLKTAGTTAPLTGELLQLSEQLQKIQQQQKSVAIIGRNSVFHTTQPAISTLGLTRIIHIDLTNYMVMVQAGVSLHTLAQTLRAHGVYCVLPDQPGTLGGAFSSGCFPEFYAHVTGIRALLADGSSVRYGGKLTKNAAGYNLIRLFAGAQGTLGLVTELTFKVYALPCTVLSPLPACPLKKTRLWQAVKHEVDPHNVFIPPQEGTR